MAHIRFESCVIENEPTGNGMPVYVDGIEAIVTLDKSATLKYQFLPARPGEEAKRVLRRPDFPALLAQPPFDRQVIAYLEGRDTVDGTPLEVVAAFTRAQVENVKTAGLNTVEGLAACDWGQIEHLGPSGIKMKEQAQAYLDALSGTDTEKEAMKAEIAELRRLIEEGQAAPKKDASGDKENNMPGFFEACCEMKEGGSVSSGALYKAYLEWCQSSDLQALPQNVFGMHLVNIFELQKTKTSEGVFYSGISLIPAA